MASPRTAPPSNQQPVVDSQGKATIPWDTWFRAVGLWLQQFVFPSGTGQLVITNGADSVAPGNLTGAVTTAGGTVTTIAATGVTAGTYGDGSHVSQVTINASGQVTSAADVAISISSGIDQLTGDVTAGPGSGSQAATLATVNSNVGAFGDATHVGAFTVNAKGLITAASSVAITDTGITQLTGDVTAGPGSGSQASTLATVNSNVGSFGDSTHVAAITVNAKGLITAAASTAIAIDDTQALMYAVAL